AGRDATAHGAGRGDLPGGVRPGRRLRYAGEDAGPIRRGGARGQGSCLQHGADGRPRAGLHARHCVGDRAQCAESPRVPGRAQPRLTCGTYVRDVRKGAVTVEPLSNFPILKDLVVDFDDFLRKLASVTPYIVRKDWGDLRKEYVQYPEDVEAYRQQSLCINCMLCYAACPVFGSSPEFVGPAASA